MLILQWNINGYQNNYIYLETLLKKYKPDLVALQETHVPMNKSIKSPKPYFTYFHNTHDTSKQGIAILVKKKYST